MKPTRIILLASALILAYCLSSCSNMQNQVKSVTTTTTPDGTKTVTEIIATNSDAVLAASSTLISAGLNLTGRRIYATK
jgi:hypothetical protein